jgi:hypothetical protein
MPSNKTLFVLIICFGIVTSVYLLARNSKSVPFLTQNTNSISTNPYINLSENINSDWQKILVNVDSSKSTTTILTMDNSSLLDETTLTAQMSRDFLSQYLLAIKKGSVTPEESAKIAEITLSTPGYTNLVGVKYVSTNLHVTTKSDSFSLQIYKNAVNQVLKDKSSQLKEDPASIFQDAINSASENKLKKLDPIILLNKGFLNDLLNIEVPQKAVGVHLALLNASSNILSDLEAMRVVFTDPVRSLSAIGQYNRHRLDLKIALENINKFFLQN